MHRVVTRPVLLPNGLTARQAEILDAFVELLAEGGRPLTFRDMMRRMKVSSPNGMQHQLRALAGKGWLTPSDFATSRGWRLTTKALAAYRKVTVSDGEVTVRLLAPELSLSPEAAEALAADLLAAARAARSN